MTLEQFFASRMNEKVTSGLVEAFLADNSDMKIMNALMSRIGNTVTEVWLRSLMAAVSPPAPVIEEPVAPADEPAKRGPGRPPKTVSE